MRDYSTIINNAFELGSIKDAQMLFETCVKNAFPTFSFRNLELIRFTKDPMLMEGRSWNHIFEIIKTQYHGFDVWKIQCRRVTMGKTPDKQVYLDYATLDFTRYA